MTQIFAYIPFMNGVAADVALEFPSAAKKIDEGASLTAVVTGSGADLDKVAEEMTSIYSEVIKIDNADLAYPNGEVVRKALVSIIPADAILNNEELNKKTFQSITETVKKPEEEK